MSEAAILVMWYKVWLTFHKFSYEIRGQLAKWFLSNYVLKYWCDSNMSDIG